MNAARSLLACRKPFRRYATHSTAPVVAVSPSPIVPLFLPPLPDPATCVSALQACASTGDLSEGEKIHSWVVIKGFHASPFVLTSLVNFYSKCGRPGSAFAVFRCIESPNLFQWNAVISGMVANGLLEEALGLYFEMEGAGLVPDRFTYPCLVKACSDLKGGPLAARSVHGRLLKMGLASDVFISSALINAYVKMGLANYAKRVFDRLSEKDVVLWNSMVNGFAQMGQFEDALEFFHRMGKEGFIPSKFTVTGLVSVFTATGDLTSGRKIHGFVKKSGYEYDIAVSNSLIGMYGKCQSVEEANQIFEVMPQRDIFSWNSMISVAEQSGDHRRTLKLFHCMRDSGILPDPVTISAVLPACAHLAALLHGRVIHGFLILNGLRKNGDVFLDNAVMDMYAKGSSLDDDAKLVFDVVYDHDVASWNNEMLYRILKFIRFYNVYVDHLGTEVHSYTYYSSYGGNDNLL